MQSNDVCDYCENKEKPNYCKCCYDHEEFEGIQTND